MNAWLRWDLIRRHLATVPAAGRVLEIGMGQGAVAARLAARWAYTGIEPDEVSRTVATGRLPASARVAAELAELESRTTFDVVCAFEVVEHIDDDTGAVAAWAAHLVPGGVMMLSVPAYERRFSAADRLVGHRRRYSRPQLRSLVEAAGLDVVSIDATGFPLGFVLERARNVIAIRRERQLTDPEGATGAGSRWLQPPGWLGPGTQAITWPFRLVQRPFTRTGLATGWLVVARKPAS
jgi:SAM-dependent methyltransferase